ncbi:DUF3619 family protein [Methylobacillus flagellatus]|uniref:DUF3619 family protein n=1 Tax=Methylobacillus flagellatus TaxID=405 RepID=UPI0010F7658C|nr:DUF3619 family protein [Methylobacillus flagellatus]
MKTDTTIQDIVHNTMDQQQQAKQIVSMLEEASDALDTRVLERLRVARYRALAQAAQPALAVPGWQVLKQHAGQFLHLHQRAVMSAAMLGGSALLVFALTQQFAGQEITGQGDAFLLASELPPEAYLDRGFDTWLKRTAQQ